MSAPPVPMCDYAGCTTIAVYPDDGWDFCWRHYLEHRADLHDEPWPKLQAADLKHLFAAPCGTPGGAKRHYRTGEKPCGACLEAGERWRNPGGSDRRRGSWYRPVAS